MDKLSLPLIGAVCFINFVFSTNTFSQWTLCGTVQATGQLSISVADPNTVAIVGGTGSTPKVFLSTAGCNFTPLGTSGIPYELYCVWAKDANTIFVGDGGSAGGAGGNAKVYKTTNGGINWTAILSTGGSSGFINGIVFSRTMPLFGVAQSDPPAGAGQPYWIARTSDGGNNWTISSAPGVPGAFATVNSLVVIDNLFYGFGLNSGARVLVTANGGTSWISSPLAILGSFVTGFAFSSDKIYGIAATSTSLPVIARTSGSGWSQVNVGASVSGNCTMKWVYGTNVCYLTSSTGASGCVVKSTNAGLNWMQMTTAGVSGIIHMELVYTGGVVYAYAVSQNGTVIRLIDNITGANENQTVIPAEYKLEQNFPNPFNPVTTIKFDVPQSLPPFTKGGQGGFVTLIIYDALGREIATLVNEPLKLGVYEVNWDGTDYSSGIYFYKLMCNEFVETKKMVLIK